MSNQQSSTSVADGEQLKKTEYLGYALGDTASGFFFQTFNIFLIYYYVDVWGIPATALLWLFPAVRSRTRSRRRGGCRRSWRGAERYAKSRRVLPLRGGISNSAPIGATRSERGRFRRFWQVGG